MLSDFRFRSGQRKALATLARVVCPPELSTLGVLDEVLEETELMVRALPTYLRTGLVAGLTAFDQGFRVYPGAHGKRFADATDLAAAEHYYESWHASAFPVQFQFAKAIKGLICFSYYEHPRVLAALGVHGDQWIAKVAKERLAKYADDIRRADAEVTQ